MPSRRLGAWVELVDHAAPEGEIAVAVDTVQEGFAVGIDQDFLVVVADIDLGDSGPENIDPAVVDLAGMCLVAADHTVLEVAYCCILLVVEAFGLLASHSVIFDSKTLVYEAQREVEIVEVEDWVLCA